MRPATAVEVSLIAAAGLAPWLILAVALLVGALSVLFDVAYPAYLPAVVDKQRLVDANGALMATRTAGALTQRRRWTTPEFAKFMHSRSRSVGR